MPAPEIIHQLAATDRAIDTLVNQLYDLTPAEIAIVDGSNSNRTGGS